MKKQILPTLANYEDCRIKTGLSFLIAGTITRTDGGHMSETTGGADYVADAINSRGLKIYGLCKNHSSYEQFFQSPEYADFVKNYGE